MDSAIHTTIIIIAFCIAFPILWMVIILLISYIVGWQKLAKTYHTLDFPKDVKTCSALMNFCGYNSTLLYAMTKKGLFLKTVKLFSIGHMPLFIPWDKMEFKSGPFYVFYSIKMTVDDVSIYFRQDILAKTGKIS